MINNTPESKLDETVKNTLNNYEAPYDASDWSRMESMLDAAPKSGSFKWSHAITVIIGIAVIGGGYALYSVISDKNSQDTSINNTTAPEIKTEKTEVAVPPAAKNNTLPDVPTPPKEEPKAAEVTKENIPVPVKAEPEPKIAAKEDKKMEKKKKTAEKTVEAPIIEKNDRILGMGNEPIFGDMLDSSKGIVGETKEKEETRKAAKAKKDTPVGWNKFMLPNVNTDSLRKYREQRDSLKTQ